MKHHVKYNSLKEETWVAHAHPIPLHGNCLRKMLTTALHSNKGLCYGLLMIFRKCVGFMNHLMVCK